MNENDTWELIIDKLKKFVSTDDFDTWFSSANLKSISPDNAVIEVPNKFIAAWPHETFITRLADSFQDVTGTRPSIEFSFPPGTNHYRDKKTSKIEEYFNSFNTINPFYTFESFIKIKSNDFSVFSVFEVIKNPGRYCNPLYLFSPFKVGKSHLLNAIGNEIRFKHPSFRVGFTSGNHFCGCISSEFSDENIDKIRQVYISLDILLFDDVDSLAGKDRPQQEFISIFDALHRRGKQIVVAAKTAPGQAKTFLPQFRSRLEWGVLSEIEAPDLRGKMTFIRKKISGQSLQVPDDVCFFLANNANDFGDLDLLLHRLKSFCSTYHPELDLCTVQSLVQNLPKETITIDIIKKSYNRRQGWNSRLLSVEYCSKPSAVGTVI